MLLRQTAEICPTNAHWSFARPNQSVGVHLAIFVEPYLRLILEGKKTIESRFGVHRSAPHGRVQPGDVLFLKASGGPVVGLCQVGETWFFDLRETSLATVRARFARELCAEDPAFWQARAHAKLATLMRVDHVVTLPPISIPKRDRRPWVIIREAVPLTLTGAS